MYDVRSREEVTIRTPAGQDFVPFSVPRLGALRNGCLLAALAHSHIKLGQVLRNDITLGIVLPPPIRCRAFTAGVVSVASVLK